MGKLPKLKLTLPCRCCAQRMVVIKSKSRYLRMKRLKQRPACNQCRRYVAPGEDRVVESAPSDILAPTLIRKRGRGAKRVRRLESCRVGLAGTTGLRPRVKPDKPGV